MYGTIARFNMAPENRAKAEEALVRWEREMKPSADGAAGAYLLWPDDDARTGYLVAMFEDEDRYRSNAGSEHQDRWYRSFRQLLDSDPEWIDGRFVTP